MIVYKKRLPMFFGFLLFFLMTVYMVIVVNDAFHQIRDYGGILFPMFSHTRANIGVSWLVWLFLFSGVFMFIYMAFLYLKFWARKNPAIILIINDQGVYTPQLKPGKFIPWIDIEGYEIRKHTTTIGITFKNSLIIRIKNPERYLAANWWGGYPDFRVMRYGASERLEAMCQCLDQYLCKKTSEIRGHNT